MQLTAPVVARWPPEVTAFWLICVLNGTESVVRFYACLVEHQSICLLHLLHGSVDAFIHFDSICLFIGWLVSAVALTVCPLCPIDSISHVLVGQFKRFQVHLCPRSLSC